jgi:siroheme synthase (precorrin-2 oxidase/ferrochelatase)
MINVGQTAHKNEKIVKIMTKNSAPLPSGWWYNISTAKYPIYLEMSGRRAVVIGGGEVAVRKVESLAEAGARVTMVAEHFAAGVEEAMALLIGQSLRTGDVSLEMEAAGAILLESSGGAVKLSNLSETSLKGFITTSGSVEQTGFELEASEKRALSPQQPKLLKP